MKFHFSLLCLGTVRTAQKGNEPGEAGSELPTGCTTVCKSGRMVAGRLVGYTGAYRCTSEVISIHILAAQVV